MQLVRGSRSAPIRRHTTRLSTALSVTVVLASSLALAKCAAQSVNERVVASELKLNTAKVTEGTTRWRVTVSRDTMTRDLGVMTSSTSFVEHEGIPAVLLVRTFPTPQGEIVDSAMALRHTLAPVWQHSHQPTKTMLLTFSDSGVSGEWARTDSGMRAVHHPTERAVFDATGQDLLISSLPLAEGYRALIPMYTFELGGMELDTLHVVGTDRVSAPDGTMREAWKVSFGDPFITSTIWVDRESSRILREDVVSRRNGMLFREVPIS